MAVRRKCWYMIIALTFLGEGSPASAEAKDGRLSGRDLRPTFQAIHLTLDPRESEYSGSVEIRLAVSSETDHFSFHSSGHVFERVALSGAEGEISIRYERQGEDRVGVRTAEPLGQGTYTLTVAFEASFGSPLQGLYTVERDGSSYAFTVFQPIDARRAFPCWDDPRFKIPFRVTATVPVGNLVVSSSPEEQVEVAKGWRTVRFRDTLPLPSYGVSLAVGPFESVPIEGLGVPGRLITAKGMSHLAPMAAAGSVKILAALERYLGRPYPYEKLDLLAVPGFPGGGLENPAAVVFSEDVLLLDPATASANRRRNQAEIVAHELSHMWFGNLVTLEWWDDVWLNESFATWMAYKIVEEVFPELRVDALKARRVQRAFELDAQSTAPPIRREFASPLEAFTVSAPLTYQKGSQVLAMIETWVGEKAFREGVKAYLEAHAWKNAEAADFWRAIDRSSGRKVSASMAAFIVQPGFPLVEVEIRDQRLHIRQQRFSNHGQAVEALTWGAPVAVKLISGRRAQSKTFFMADPGAAVRPEAGPAPPGSFSLAGSAASSDPVDLVYPNADASGYYRWQLPVHQLKSLAAAASETLTARERLDLVSNSAALLAAGRLAGDAYLDILRMMAGDADPVVVSSVLAALRQVKTALVSRELETSYAEYLRRAVTPAWDRVGLEAKTGEPEMAAELRSELYALIGRDRRFNALRQHVRETVDAYLSEGGGEPPNPALVPSALRLAALSGDRELFSAYRARLGASQDPSLRRDLVFEWLMENHEAVTSRLPPFLHSFLPLFARGCSMERLAKAEAFFAKENHRVAGTDRQLAQVAEQVGDCVRLGKRERAVVARYLRSANDDGE